MFIAANTKQDSLANKAISQFEASRRV